MFIFLFLGTSDPYVKFKISGKQLYKSRTVNRTLEPYWDEFFTIPVEDVFEPLHIRVYDYDFALQDDYMGSAQIDLTHLELNRYLSKYFVLYVLFLLPCLLVRQFQKTTSQF